jgi:hypothetical protein
VADSDYGPWRRARSALQSTVCMSSGFEDFVSVLFRYLLGGPRIPCRHKVGHVGYGRLRGVPSIATEQLQLPECETKHRALTRRLEGSRICKRASTDMDEPTRAVRSCLVGLLLCHEQSSSGLDTRRPQCRQSSSYPCKSTNVGNSCKKTSQMGWLMCE